MVYNKLCQQSSEVPWWPLLWHRYNVPKFSFIAWMVYQGRVLTLEKLRKFMPLTMLVCYALKAEILWITCFFRCAYSSTVLCDVMKCMELRVDSCSFGDWLLLFFQARSGNILYRLRSAALNGCIYMIW